MTYDAVLVSDSISFQNRATLGTNLADYVDQGGGVVQMMATMQTGFDLLGRWATDGYACIRSGVSNAGSTTTTAIPIDIASPLVQGVTGITTQYRSLGGLNAARGAVSVWDFTDGTPAVCRATFAGHRRVDLNFYALPLFYTDLAPGDGGVLVKNALLYVSGGGIVATPPALDFSATGVGIAVTKTLTLTNGASVPVTINALAVTNNPAEFSVVTPPALPLVLAGSAQLPLTVRFEATVTGLRNGELTIITNSSEEPTIKVPLRGTTGPPAIQVDTANLLFPTTNVGASSSPVTITASNVGFSDLVVSTPLSASLDFVVDATGFAGTVAPAGRKTFTVSFAPSGGGTQTSTVTVSSNDPNRPTVSISVSGFGRVVEAGTGDASSTDAPTSDAGPDAGATDGASEDAPPATPDAFNDAEPADAAAADASEGGSSPPDASLPGDAGMTPDGSTAAGGAAATGGGGTSAAGGTGGTSGGGRAGTTAGSSAGGRAGSSPAPGKAASDDSGGCSCRAPGSSSGRASISAWRPRFDAVPAARHAKVPTLS